ncbi:hypothetical protein PSACC_01390 [Paramicrosporidium saccamoebae]|uniref:D-lactate dehydratase n=1 Tax=Paramicrosporidium saccamoebae TaxID=1246581 RepID=A0A2H9TM37_9FUNG|nr:hypothetical protein PSACC_01390 [Paramicrosporidium saccamoebae]
MPKALVLIADGSEEIEAVTVVDVLRRADVNVTLAAVKDNLQVHCSRHVVILADELLANIPDASAMFDAIIIPGGINGAKILSNRVLMEFENSNKWIAAMCAGPTVLHAADIGKGKRATSYPLFKSRVEGHFEYQEEDVVVHGKLITSRGPATAMLWAVIIAKELCGVEKAKEVSMQMLFKTPW